MTKIQDAIGIRDRLFLYAKQFGSMKISNGYVSLRVDEGHLSARFSKRPSPAETWGVDIYVSSATSISQIPSPTGKVMNLQWNSNEQYYMLSFRRGNWEQMDFLLPIHHHFGQFLPNLSQHVSKACRLQLPHAMSFEKAGFLMH